MCIYKYIYIYYIHNIIYLDLHEWRPGDQIFRINQLKSRSKPGGWLSVRKCKWRAHCSLTSTNSRWILVAAMVWHKWLMTWVMWAATPGRISWSSSRSSCAQAPVEFDHAAVNGKNKCKYCLKGSRIDWYQSHGTGQERNTKGPVKWLWHEDGWEVFCLVFWICCTFGTFDTKHQTCITSMHGTNMTGWWFQPLWKIWKSVEIIVPNIWKYTKCSKPPTRWVGVYHVHLSHQWLTMLYPFGRSARMVLEHIWAIMGVGWGCLWHIGIFEGYHLQHLFRFPFCHGSTPNHPNR